MESNKIIVIKGSGEMASGVAHCLADCHFAVVMTDIPWPTAIRRSVCFAQAIFKGTMIIEGMTAKCVPLSDIFPTLAQGQIPIVIDPEARIVQEIRPLVVIDAILAKKNLGTKIQDAELVIGLGPGFEAGKDVHYCIETMRGHSLGQLIQQGTALPNTGIPGDIAGFTAERVLYAPEQGIFKPCKDIGDFVQIEEQIGTIGDHAIQAKIAGVIRGLIYPLTLCHKGQKNWGY